MYLGLFRKSLPDRTSLMAQNDEFYTKFTQTTRETLGSIKVDTYLTILCTILLIALIVSRKPDVSLGGWSALLTDMLVCFKECITVIIEILLLIIGQLEILFP